MLVENKSSTNPSKDSLTKEDWNRIDLIIKKSKIDELSTLIDIYPHIKAFDQTLKKSMANQLKDYLVDPDLKSKLYKTYENNFGNLYKDEIKKYNTKYLFMMSSGKFGWSSLPTLGKNAFMTEEYLIKGDDSYDF